MTNPTMVFPLSALEGAVFGYLTDPSTGETRTGLKEQDVRAAFTAFTPIMRTDASDDELEQLVRHVLAAVSADIPGPGPGPVIKKDHEPWLKEMKPEINWRRWRAYRKMLSKQGRSGRVLDRLDKFTDDVLDLAGNPQKPGRWNRRGLIIGDVQSGKTQNYLALINKAADAGYRLVIILSGNTEYLRRQTHERVDEGFIGRDTRRVGMPKGAVLKDVHIGVGKIDQEVANATSLTTVLMDYLQATKNGIDVPLPSSSSGPLVFVLKKNKFVLDAVNGWARGKADNHGRIDLPVLLLDDESDYASVNTNEAEDPTAINGSIRKILSSFTRSSYVAITATPFANIFIDYEASGIVQDDGEAVDDLFPEDYIYPLEAPSNYVGIRATFGTDEEDRPQSVHYLTDAQQWIPLKHRKTQVVGPLPESLKEALRTFLISNAILDARVKSPPKRSMLVNVSRFTNVQDTVGDLLTEELYRYKSAIELHALTYSAGKSNAVLDELKSTFEKQFASTGPSWTSILAELHKSVADVRVKVYNSSVDKAEDEDYREEVPTRQIAVGGDLLSRGLTLDGLVVSYFHRSVGAADTMMQMARWFGYRDGFQDVCRLWISEKSAADYRFVGAAIQELRDDLAHMRRNNMTPRDFGLAVQQHPESLLITARNKMKHTVQYEKEVNLLGRNLETRKLSANPAVQAENFDAAQKLAKAALASGCSTDESARGYTRFRNVPKDLVADLLHIYKAADDDIFFTGSGLERMVRASPGEQFQTWDVTFMNGPKKKGESEQPSLAELVPGKSVFKVGRALMLRQLTANDGTLTGSSLWVSGKKTRLAGSDDLRKVLDPDVEAEAIAAYLDQLSVETAEVSVSAQGGFLPERALYRHLPRPQLMVYAVEPSHDDGVLPDENLTVTPEISELMSELTVAARDPKAAFIALKIALPTSDSEYNSKNGRVKYVLNKVAQRYWMADYEELS
ncbi:Z1 domain-containing protein [Arthrobacter sp. efr-133-R2A-63]|uniref:Z1 domain-containing protein n=1 Tax=Arthrobacter sp. efr-133-R2A-63 TaxID=3040278 RepID=UPI00255027E4|nr:Z1 domain-containing protein [Arthrobacter sp. efr-133-R2A-63]